MVSRSVEFKFLNKPLLVLGMKEIQHPASTSTPGGNSTAAKETSDHHIDTSDLDLEHILKDLLENGDSEKGDTDHQWHILNAISKCLELVWKQTIYQVQRT